MVYLERFTIYNMILGFYISDRVEDDKVTFESLPFYSVLSYRMESLNDTKKNTP